MSRLAGKVAIVTAATKGIGFAIAKKLAKDGAKIIINSRKAQNVDEAVQKLNDDGIDVKGIVCHVSDGENRKKLFEEASKLGGLDILVSCAGVNPYVGPLFECPEREWDKIFDVNLKSSYLVAKEALPLLKKSKAGRIIFISTIGAFNTPIGIAPYAISKLGLLGLTKHAAIELGPNNITVNAVCPGLIRTKFGEVVTEKLISAEAMLSHIPLKRFGEPDDISGCVAFLASDEASYLTGENILISGGMTARI